MLFIVPTLQLGKEAGRSAGTYGRQSNRVYSAQALGFDLGSGYVTAKGSSIFQSLIFLICKMKSDCSFYRGEIYPRYIRYPTQSRHSTNVSCSFLFRGILSMSWNQADAELLLSSAKDNQILCWNLGSSEVGWSFCGRAGRGNKLCFGLPSF